MALPSETKLVLAIASAIIFVGFMLRRFAENREGSHMNDGSSDPSTVLNDGLGDWRFRAIHKIQRGGRLQVMSTVGQLQAPSGETFNFTDFMSVALYLNVAMTADAKANELRDLTAPEQFVASAGPYTTIRHEKLGMLFDFIEQSTLAAVFSFLALEAYSNFVIHFELRDGEHVFRCPIPVSQATQKAASR